MPLTYRGLELNDSTTMRMKSSTAATAAATTAAVRQGVSMVLPEAYACSTGRFSSPRPGALLPLLG